MSVTSVRRGGVQVLPEESTLAALLPRAVRSVPGSS